MKAALALGLLLAVAATASATWGGLFAPITPVLDAAGQSALVGTVAETLRGVAGEAPEPPQPELATTCGGTAPITTACAAELTAPAGSVWTLRASGGTGFTGTIVATLRDAHGATATWTCTYTLYVGGVSEAPACSGSGADLAAGTLSLAGAVTDLASGAPSAGGWEVSVDLA